jgi:hypothetical protein
MDKNNENDVISSTQGKNKKNFYFTILLILILSIFILSIFLSFTETVNHHTIVPSIKDNNIINDTISPSNINQAVSIEIMRVHKRGIEDLFRKVGTEWKKTPTFFIQAHFEEDIWKSIEVNSYDTGYVSWQANKFVEDETEQYEITIQVIEIQSKLFKNIEQIMETFTINFDFRTGRWTGDDTFNDSDGYGHYVGDDYEIWFKILQTEQDGDNIPYWWEINKLFTDPKNDDSREDPDNDGIPTDWEWQWGYDPFKYDNHSDIDPDEDGLSNIEEYEQRMWLANPFHKDIYLEIDRMEDNPSPLSLEHTFWKESQWMLMDVFTPQDITVHIDDGWPTELNNGGGDILPFYNDYIGPVSGGLSTFYKYYFSDERKGVFRYVIIVESGGWCFSQTNTLNPDVLSIPCNREFFRNVYFPPAVTPKLRKLAMAIAVIHELGHSLNLNPDYCQGIDNASQVGRNNLPPIQKLIQKMNARSYWDTYESVMNYAKFGRYVIDYSDGTHGIHDSNDWVQIDLTFFQKPINEKYGIGDE